MCLALHNLNAMRCPSWILKANGNVVPQQSARPLTMAKLHSPTEGKKRKLFNKLIERRHGTSINLPKPKPTSDTEFENYEDNDEPVRKILDIEQTVNANGQLIDQHPTYNVFLNAEMCVLHGDEYVTSKVVWRALDLDCVTAGVYNDNPMLNSIVYEFKFSDGQTKE